MNTVPKGNIHVVCDISHTMVFRIGSKGAARKMLELVEGQLIKECINQEGEEKIPNIFPLPW